MTGNYPSDDCLVLPKELPPFIFRKLSVALEKDNAWLKIAEYCHNEEIFDAETFHSIKRCGQPTEKLLIEFGCRLCDVRTLCSILENCQLYSALLLFKPSEPIVIHEQPQGNRGDGTLVLMRGGSFRLACIATGLPPPRYQWFLDGDELADAKGPYLALDNFDIEKEGDYYCVLSQDEFESITSDYITVSLAPEHPVILQEPRPQIVCRLGTSTQISVQARGNPELSYQWFKGSRQLDGFTKPDLPLDSITGQIDGDYRCYIHNSAGELWSNVCQVSTFASHEDVNENLPRPVASAKVALLIANQDYCNMSSLRTPVEDARTLAEILVQHNFQVIALQNLNLVEMRNVILELCNILPRNAYVVFYFAGHGFEMKDKCMLPVCAPGPGLYKIKDAVSEGELLRAVLDTQPQVFLELLDMCLKSPELENKAIFEEVSTLHQYSANNNLIQGYSTTSYLSSYERKSERNGLYVKFLKRYLTQDVPMVTVLANVARDMEKESVKQMPYRGTNVTKSFRLSDPCTDCDQVKQKVERLWKVPQIQAMLLERSGVESLVTCIPLFNVYCNVLQVVFTNLQGYRVTCDIKEPNLQLLLERQGSEVIITVLNLQRIRNSEELFLKLESQMDDSVDFGRWTLGKPMIAAANLWRPLE